MLRNRLKEYDIERALCGAGKLKILRLLMKHPDHAFTQYEIRKTVPNDPVSIRNDLTTFVKLNWVTTIHVSNLTKYVLNLENNVMKHLADFLRNIRYI